MEPAEDDGAATAALKEMELSQGAVLRFLAERGGRARNADLLEHFHSCLNSPEPERRAQARQRFKEMVNAVAVVKQEPRDGTKYVQLRKKHWRKNGGGSESIKDASEAGEGERSNRRSAEERDAAKEAGKEPEENTGREPEETPGRIGLEPEENTGREPEKTPGRIGLKPEENMRREPEETPRTAGLEPEETMGREPEEKPGGGGLEPEEKLAEEGESGAPSPPSAPASSSSSSGLALKKSRRLGSSPQMKRSGSDWEGASGAEEESSSGGCVALDPLEHAWMLLCASWEGRWESLEAVLSGEPALLGRRDFVTGFSCLHWAAKHGRPELLARLVGFARRRGLAVDVNARTAGGYTALHLAAMHGRLEVVKLLVGAYDADVELRDYSGKKAAQYLSAGAAGLRSLIGGAGGEAGSGAGGHGGGGAGGGGGGRWRLSKVLPTHLLAHRPAHHEEGEPAPAEGALPVGKLSRKSSSGRAKARLHKVRFRTQIVHTTPSFRAEADDEEEEGAPEERPLKGSFKLRPKSNVFG